ncbi:unnamed protein product, partial [marine sediment metagenome]
NGYRDRLFASHNLMEEATAGGATYKLYSVIYPFLYLISKLDYLFVFTRGARLIVEARKH